MHCSRSEAQALVARTDFVWHQKFDLGDGIFTPGANDIAWLLNMARFPADLSGQTVLDVGTTNGGAAFIAERRGAERVVAVDISDEKWYGFGTIRDALASKVEFKQSSIYELPALLNEEFDIVLFLGVLYHLRHPLLALDNVRALTRGIAWIESATEDEGIDEDGGASIARFYRKDGYGSDSSNWFIPSTPCLVDWCSSAGLHPKRVIAWPPTKSQRTIIEARPVSPEYLECSYEFPVSVVVNRK